MNIFRSKIGSLNEVLFTNRNKNYGAYAIRTAYGNTVFKSLGISGGSMLGIMWLLYILVNGGKVVEKETIISTDTMITVELNQEEKKLTQQIKRIEQKAPAANNTLVEQRIVNDPVVETEHPTTGDPGPNTNNNGNSLDPGPVIPGTEPGGKDTTGDPGPSIVTTFTNLAELDALPSYPGLSGFLKTNLHYPPIAVREETQGKVVISFTIDETGNIIDTKVYKGIGYGCDEEAMRVIKLTGKWKPGIFMGKPVKVSFKQVIEFKIQ